MFHTQLHNLPRQTMQLPVTKNAVAMRQTVIIQVINFHHLKHINDMVKTDTVSVRYGIMAIT